MACLWSIITTPSAPRSGVDPHPHRKMEMGTWVLSGSLAQQGSEGTCGIIYPELAQRMTAGTGIWHSERNDQTGNGPVELVQIWTVPNQLDVTPGFEHFEPQSVRPRRKLGVVAVGIPEHKHETAIRVRNRRAGFHVKRPLASPAHHDPRSPFRRSMGGRRTADGRRCRIRALQPSHRADLGDVYVAELRGSFGRGLHAGAGICGTSRGAEEVTEDGNHMIRVGRDLGARAEGIGLIRGSGPSREYLRRRRGPAEDGIRCSVGGGALRAGVTKDLRGLGSAWRMGVAGLNGPRVGGSLGGRREALLSAYSESELMGEEVRSVASQGSVRWRAPCRCTSLTSCQVLRGLDRGVAARPLAGESWRSALAAIGSTAPVTLNELPQRALFWKG